MNTSSAQFSLNEHILYDTWEEFFDYKIVKAQKSDNHGMDENI